MYLVPNIHPGSGSAGVPTVQANFAGSPADWTTLDSTSTMPTGGSISRAGNAMLYDSTGKLTYAPNNQLLQSNTLSDSSVWRYGAAGSVSGGISDPFGGTSAWRYTRGTSSSDPAFLGQRITSGFDASVALIYSVWVKVPSGTMSILLNISDWTTKTVGSSAITVTTTWQRAFFAISAGTLNNTGQVFVGISGSGLTSGALIDVYGEQLEAVTYQTTPSTYNATTTSAYYGPRFDYDPVTLAAKGLLVEGTRTNIATYSDQLNNAVYNPVTYYATVSPNATTSPDGTVNADKVIADTSNNAHLLRRYDAPVFSANTTYTWSVYAKDAGYALQLQMYDGAFRANTVFNLTNGTISSTTSGTATITPVGNGWYRCSVTATTGASVSVSLVDIGLNKIGTGNSFVGDGVSGVFAWGAQLETGSFATSYIPTVASSVARAAETFSLTGYANRLVEAYYIDEETGGSYSGNSALSTGTVTVSPPTFGWVTSLRAYINAYAGSISTPSWLSFSRASNAMMTDSTGTLTFAANNLLLNTATLSTQTVTTGIIPTCDVILSFKGTGSVAISGGYTGTLAGTGASDRVFLKFTTTTASLTFTVTGTVTEAQLERVTYQTRPSLYVANTGSQSYGPRYDYDPSTVPATPRGLLIEESRANICLSSQSNTNWTATNASYAASGISPDGTSALLLKPDTTSNIHFINQSVTFTAAAHTYSVYAKANGYNYIRMGIPSFSASFNLSNGTVGATSGSPTTSITPVGNGWYRCSLTGTVSAGSSTIPISVNNIDSASSVTYTGDGVSGVLLWGAQLEAGSFATSYIPTTTASVTRAADVAQLTGSALTTLQGTQMTLAAEAVSSVATNRYLINARKISGGNYGDYYSLGSLSSSLNVATVNQANLTYSPSPTTTSIFRAAFAIQANNFAAVANNGTVQTDGTGSIVTGIDQGWLGGYSDGVYLNGYVRSMALYNTRLPDAILKQKSTVNAPY